MIGEINQSPRCDVCGDTGDKHGDGYLTCNAPGCDVVEKRLALQKFVNGLECHSEDELTWAVYQYAQRQCNPKN